MRVSDGRRIGDEGQGFAIALSALDSGRLGIAACADRRRPGGAGRGASAYATGRQQFGRPIADFQGLRFMLADMATQIEAGRALYLTAARLRDAGRPFAKQAAMAKLFCTDTAMQVTTDAVQILGGYGYTADFPAERLHARGQGPADRRGHQPDPADGHRPSPRGSRDPLNRPAVDLGRRQPDPLLVVAARQGAAAVGPGVQQTRGRWAGR